MEEISFCKVHDKHNKKCMYSQYRAQQWTMNNSINLVYDITIHQVLVTHRKVQEHYWPYDSLYTCNVNPGDHSRLLFLTDLNYLKESSEITMNICLYHL